MLGIARPNFSLKVEQPQSTFAEGNARWYVFECSQDGRILGWEWEDELADRVCSGRIKIWIRSQDRVANGA